MQLVPQEVFLTKGVGVHKEQLISFELALRQAGIALQNLVPVSSIYPAHCQMISREEGIKRLVPGAITFCVLARQTIKEANQWVNAGIGLAIPENKGICGYISEHHGIGMPGDDAANYVMKLAKELLDTAIGGGPDWNPQYQEQVPLKTDGNPDLKYKLDNTTMSVYTERDDVWTTVLGAAVFIL